MRIAQTVSQIGLRLLLGLTLLAAPAWGADCKAVVRVARLNVRAQPSLEAKILGTLARGDRITVLDRKSGWLKITFDGGLGFLYADKDYVEMAAPVQNRDRLQQRAEAIERQIAAGRAEVAAIDSRERAVVAQLEEIGQRLNQARGQLASLQKEMAVLEGRMAATRGQMAALRRERQALGRQASRRVTALYKLYWLGRIQVLAAAPGVNELLYREEALNQILAADEKKLARLAGQRTALDALMTAHREQQQTHEALAADIQVRLQAVNREREKRQKLLAEIQDQKSFQLAAIEALQQAAQRLDKAIESLGDPAPAKAGADGQIQAFEARKGLLTLPVSGKIIHRFGPYRHSQYNVMNFRSGIDIQAERGEPVRAVHKGRVLFADWFTGYGNMIIIDHGDAYYTVYAHVDALFKTKGAAVNANEVIATVGDTGSLEGAMLHFEIRHHGKPMDPSGWIETG